MMEQPPKGPFVFWSMVEKNWREKNIWELNYGINRPKAMGSQNGWNAPAWFLVNNASGQYTRLAHKGQQ